LKKEKEKKSNHKLKRFFLNGIRPPKIGLIEKKKEKKKKRKKKRKKKKKELIIIRNGFEKKKHDLFFEDS
jgi:hypothetical protein